MAFKALLLFVLPTFLLLSTIVASNETGEKIEVKVVAPVKPPTLAPPCKVPTSPYTLPTPAPPTKAPTPPYKPPVPAPPTKAPTPPYKPPTPSPAPQPKPQLLCLQLNPLHHYTSHRRLHLLISHQIHHCHQLGQERIASHYVERGVNYIQGLNCA
ncbi:lysine-rich arabinogalactan protein 19-like isoform X1 [Hibiscus syriacus]|uniref:lysine-rich arabinogalactan protein 19-like isoform X1 n=1 Tax=Hibiscus syriacus TaxID=106335 RepID=UPI00192398D0|nr:lysine-rich arabinogalactan protein 19-like isoform X1 [Hibiscus syriacus]